MASTVCRGPRRVCFQVPMISPSAMTVGWNMPLLPGTTRCANSAGSAAPRSHAGLEHVPLRPVGQLPLPLGNAPTVPALRELRQFWQVGRGRDHWVQRRESRRARSNRETAPGSLSLVEQ